MATHKDDVKHAAPEAHATKAPEHEPAKPPDHAPPAQPTYHSIVDEQRARSEEIQQKGAEEWKREHDDRPEDQRGASTKQVPGVTQQVDKRTK